MNEETLLDKAVVNYKAALTLLKASTGDDIYLNIIGYHLQQAVELALKYQMEQLGVEYPKTHDIDQLIRISREESADIILTDYIEEHSEMFTLWEARTRYVLGYKIEENKIKTALEKVKQFLTQIKDYEKTQTQYIRQDIP